MIPIPTEHQEQAAFFTAILYRYQHNPSFARPLLFAVPNGIENYWSLFKRALRGTYVSCNSAHLFRYLDEETFRFNNRGTNDAVRFALVLGMVTGKRITYDQLTANETFKQLRLWKRFN